MSAAGDLRRAGAAGRSAGFSVVELVIAVAVGGLLASALFTLMATQNRGYSQVRELGDVHGTLRSSAGLLAWDLRFVSPSQGDLYAIAPNSVSLRAFRGSAVVCSKDPGGWYGLKRSEGDRAFGSDSILVFTAGTIGTQDDRWRTLRLQNLTTSGGSKCQWPSAPAIDARMHLLPSGPADTMGIRVGGAVYSFQRVTYGPFQWNGRWWLGRRIAANPWEPLAGPLPDSTGLRLTYYDGTGALTATPSAVRSIEFTLRAESALRRDAARGAERDSIRMKVHVRG